MTDEERAATNAGAQKIIDAVEREQHLEALGDMYVLVNTYRSWEEGQPVNKVGAIYGPFESRAEAEKERERMNFPQQEQVFVRVVNHP